ncbi:protein tyrosine phosphatase-like domain-containing protein [Aspergillus mulundensis]|uniref:Very-long-chain (3R)-3-hydroxyacyl-CoA dehydratase n=1 Tax=Aspergillus mulundensis TaxID=1810919 RepID=A0A3D8S417_9EURO|nr:Very-long-chain (3R)-3-hydroxyacyl-CoA dehydratase [Aspergillus mulundensis]RDW81057.1 Very-long-chain (3R)-3-hydroxyacyl-CoA dehydratase [Aspergillus mulundensis]
MSSSSKPKSKQSSAPSGLTRQYLLFYNAANFFLWSTLTFRTLRLLLNQFVADGRNPLALDVDVPAVFADTYSPLLQITQSLALLEILHSLVGIVRAPVVTTVMQVASRLFVVWAVLYPFHGGIVGQDKVGELGYIGCLVAWGITECIRYGFFVMQVNGGVETVPKWWQWLRYNTFYVLYPVGISSECILSYKALSSAKEFHPLYWWFIVAVLAIYVPGSYVLYTHMIRQRRKTAGKKEGKKE